MSGKIFISYRRDDESGHAGRLFDGLQMAFGPKNLFMDVDNIEPGQDFFEVLEQRVAECDVFLAVIGSRWIQSQDERGGRRLDNPNDFVRIEIESALKQSKRVIPVLVGDVDIPRADDLPESLKALARRNAVRLTHERFRSDLDGLVRALKRITSNEQPKPIAVPATENFGDRTVAKSPGLSGAQFLMGVMLFAIIATLAVFFGR